MHIVGVIASVTTSFVSAVSRLQLSFSVGDSDNPLHFEVLPFATQTPDLKVKLEAKLAPEQASQEQEPHPRHAERLAQIIAELPKAVQGILFNAEVVHCRLSNLPESQVILLCRPSLVSKLGTLFQLCSQRGAPHDQIHFCLDEVKTIQKEFVLELFDAMSPNCRGHLQDAYALGPNDFAKHVNNMCTGSNGPQPCITSPVLPNMLHDVAKLLEIFRHFQPQYLWEFGQMVECYIKKCSPRQTVAFDFWVSVVDHQRAFAVHICRQHLLMCLQDAQDYIASLSKTQLVHLCTGVPDVRSRTTEMAKILEPLRNSPDSYFVLPGGPVQPLKSNLNPGFDPSQQQEIPVAIDSHLTGNVPMQATACDCDAC